MRRPKTLLAATLGVIVLASSGGLAACTDSSQGQPAVGLDATVPTGDADGGGADGAVDGSADDAADGSAADATLSDGLTDALTDASPGDASDGGPMDAIPDPDVKAPFFHCSEAGGDRNIYDIQDPQCPDHFTPEPVGAPGVYVELKDVIVTAVYGDTFFVQEAKSGPYSGIAVFAHGQPLDAMAQGDVVAVTGYYSEFYDTSQIYLDTWTKTGSAQVPPPYIPEYPSYLATLSPVAEMFEGVLVRVEGVKTIHTQPDCPYDYGEFLVTGGLRIDDMGYRFDARLGDEFESITGPLHYTFGNYKIEPRDITDLVVNVKGNDTAVSKCLPSECQAPADQPGTKQVVVTEIMVDPYGQDQGLEWVELYNPTAEPVDINGWEMRDCDAQKIPLAGPDLVIPSHGYLVVGASANPNTNGGVPVSMAYGSSFYLPNTIGAVLLYDAAGFQGQLVDQTRYSAFDPWFVLTAGASLERIDPTGDGTVPENWATATKKFGPTDNKGTPGKKNTATP